MESVYTVHIEVKTTHDYYINVRAGSKAEAEETARECDILSFPFDCDGNTHEDLETLRVCRVEPTDQDTDEDGFQF
jgi:hypothetical protein